MYGTINEGFRNMPKPRLGAVSRAEKLDEAKRLTVIISTRHSFRSGQLIHNNICFDSFLQNIVCNLQSVCTSQSA